MSPGTPPKTPEPSKVVQGCTVGFMALGIGISQNLAPRWFPTPPEGGFNFTRILGAGIVGGVCGAVGKLVESVRR